jgi:hypothetical protein
MTKIQVHYDLTRPVDDQMLEQISAVHSVYGILRVALAPTLDGLTVEYDATRLNPREVETVLRKAGLPIGLHV